MKPINEKERKKSIWKFLGLFVVSILPILFVVYQFASVDTKENEDLRAQVKAQSQSQEVSSAVINQRVKLFDEIRRFNQSMQRIGNQVGDDVSGDVTVPMQEIQDICIRLQEASPDSLDDSYSATIHDLSKAVEQFTLEVYKETQDDYENLRKQMEAIDN